MQSESGLSFLSRLCGRPSASQCLGPGLPPLSGQVTRVECQGSQVDHQDLLTALTIDITARLTNQLEAGVVLLDSSHKFNMRRLASQLEVRVRAQAEAQYKNMKEAGLSKEERHQGRMTAVKQWEAVRSALSRLLMVHVYTPDSLETSILNLENILAENTNISAVILLGLNAFYHQVQTEEGVSYTAYMKRLRTWITEACSDHKDTVKILSVELNIFGDKTNSEEDQVGASKPSSVVIENYSKGHSVHFQGQSAPFSFDKNNMITWN